MPPERIEETGIGAFRVEQRVYPLPLTRQPWLKAPRVIQELEGFTPLARRMGASAPAARRLFVGRGPGHGRQLLNQAEIVALAEAHGFTPVLPEQYGFWDQVALFSEAELVVGVLGAALSNLAFAPRGVTCLALAREFMGDDFFYDILCHKAGRYASVHGKAVAPEQGMGSDFTLDPALVRPFLG